MLCILHSVRYVLDLSHLNFGNCTLEQVWLALECGEFFCTPVAEKAKALGGDDCIDGICLI